MLSKNEGGVVSLQLTVYNEHIIIRVVDLSDPIRKSRIAVILTLALQLSILPMQITPYPHVWNVSCQLRAPATLTWMFTHDFLCTAADMIRLLSDSIFTIDA